MKAAIGIVAASVAGLFLSACASEAPRTTTPPHSAPVSDTGLDRMERLTLTANRCWIASREPLFAAYTLAPELSSFSGKPRFLLVPRGRPEDRPLLVVEGQSGTSAVQTFGPALETAAGPRIRSDIARWSAGASTCGA